jgi:hypothetical protein
MGGEINEEMRPFVRFLSPGIHGYWRAVRPDAPSDPTWLHSPSSTTRIGPCQRKKAASTCEMVWVKFEFYRGEPVDV